MTMEEQVQVYKEDLELLSDKDMKMEYILDYGKEAATLDLVYKTDENIIKGCSSLAWLQKTYKDGKVVLDAEGDSIIAKGMLVMLLEIFNNRTPDEILAFDPKLLMQMGVMELLSPVRQQGMEAFLGVIYGYAKQCKENQK
ncbi:MAG: cysteine desulfuration protein SufE [Sulfurimonas sp.]|jgi:cysteine desulfuration protein SufE